VVRDSNIGGGTKKVKNLINWKSFFILASVCAVTSVLVIPYQVALIPELAAMGVVLYINAFIQGVVIFSIVSFLGLLLLRKVGFSLPILEGDNRWGNFMAVLLPSVLLGVLSGVLIILADMVFQAMSVTITLSSEAVHVPVWAAFLASFYGGIAEEVLMRLFVMTLFIWLLSKIKKTKDGLPPDWCMWVAIILAAILFGLGHLPLTSELTELTAMIVVRAIVLNGIGGVIFGWLYWKKGLVSAMIAHFSADIVLHIITPLVVRAFV